MAEGLHHFDPLRMRAVSKHLDAGYAPRSVVVPATSELRKPLRGRVWHDKACRHQVRRGFSPRRVQFAATVAHRVENPLLAKEMFLFDAQRMYLDTSIELQYLQLQALPAVTERFTEAITGSQGAPVDERFCDDTLLISHHEGGGTWGHYLVQSMPRMLLFLDTFASGKIAIPASYAEGARGFGEALALYNIPPERLAPIEDATVYRLKQAILLDFLFNFETGSPHPKALGMLRNFQPRDPGAPAVKPAAFIRRKTDSLRAINNAADVEAVMSRHGVDVYGPETLSLTEQVELWRGHDLVIATLGSDLTNIVYARPGTSVLALSPNWFGDSFFFELSVAAGVRWHELRCGQMAERSPDVEHYSSFNVDVRLLDSILDGLLD